MGISFTGIIKFFDSLLQFFLKLVHFFLIEAFLPHLFNERGGSLHCVSIKFNQSLEIAGVLPIQERREIHISLALRRLHGKEHALPH